MASFGTAIASVFDVVDKTGTTIVTSVNTIAGGMSMLNDFVGAQREKQAERLIGEKVEYQDIILENAALDALKREETVKRYIGGDLKKAESYNAHYDRLKAAIAAAKNPTDHA